MNKEDCKRRHQSLYQPGNLVKLYERCIGTVPARVFKYNRASSHDWVNKTPEGRLETYRIGPNDLYAIVVEANRFWYCENNRKRFRHMDKYQYVVFGPYAGLFICGEQYIQEAW